MSSSSKCVLVVEDDDAIRQTVRDILKLVGYRVETAADGIEALAKLGSLQPDAIVLDLTMPVMDGWTFLDHWRPDPRSATCPIMVMSADSNVRVTADELHVQGFLIKPFDLEVLLDGVERLLQAVPQEAELRT